MVSQLAFWIHRCSIRHEIYISSKKKIGEMELILSLILGIPEQRIRSRIILHLNYKTDKITHIKYSKVQISSRKMQQKNNDLQLETLNKDAIFKITCNVIITVKVVRYDFKMHLRIFISRNLRQSTDNFIFNLVFRCCLDLS